MYAEHSRDTSRWAHDSDAITPIILRCMPMDRYPASTPTRGKRMTKDIKYPDELRADHNSRLLRLSQVVKLHKIRDMLSHAPARDRQASCILDEKIARKGYKNDR